MNQDASRIQVRFHRRDAHIGPDRTRNCCRVFTVTANRRERSSVATRYTRSQTQFRLDLGRCLPRSTFRANSLNSYQGGLIIVPSPLDLYNFVPDGLITSPAGIRLLQAETCLFAWS